MDLHQLNTGLDLEAVALQDYDTFIWQLGMSEYRAKDLPGPLEAFTQ